MPAVIVYRVVSLPAPTRSTKKFLNSRSVRRSPSIVGASRSVITSSDGLARRCRRLLLGVAVQLERGRGPERDRLELVGISKAHRVVGELGVEVAEQRVAALDEPWPVGVGDSQQPAEHSHR